MDSKSPKDDSGLSNTKKKLLDAKERDAKYERETRINEVNQITKQFSELFVADALNTVIHRVSTPATGKRNKDAYKK